MNYRELIRNVLRTTGRSLLNVLGLTRDWRYRERQSDDSFQKYLWYPELRP